MKYNQLQLILLPSFQLYINRIESVSKPNQTQQLVEEKLTEAFQISPYRALFQLAFLKSEIHLSANIYFWKQFSYHFANTLRLTPTIEFLRDKQEISPDYEFFRILLAEAPFFQGSEYLSESCLEYHWEKLNEYFQKEMKSFTGSVEDFFKQFSPEIHLVGKIYFHLVENKKDKEPFAFMATYAAGMDTNQKMQHRPLRFALNEFKEKQEKLLELLSTVSVASEKSKFLKQLVDSGELFYPLKLNAQESYTFLNDIPVFEEAGILCRIPNWWRSGKKGASINVSFGDSKVNKLTMDSIVQFNASVVLGDETISLEEAETILKQTEGLAQIKGKWVAVDKEKLSQSIENWKQAQLLMKKENITLGEALRMLIIKDRNKFGDLLSDDSVSVNFGSWIHQVFEKLKNPQLIRKATVPSDLKATLRPYQIDGLNWLTFLGSLKFGACLADDMGLGKTVQIVALLNNLRKKKTYSPSLLIVPASIIHNWTAELNKFAPNITYLIAHPSAGTQPIKKNLTKTEQNTLLSQYNLVITTYGMIKRYPWLNEYTWNYLILDEAQAIKNPGTGQTKAVKQLLSQNRIALTGTPIENKLSDLWSLFDFLTPGLLGTKNEFREYIKKNQDLSTLRKVISPYILRRLKTDKSIIADLPDKIELDTYAQLSKTQVVLYQQEVEKLMMALEESEQGIKRKGLVLAALMRFKQICNHPDQLLGNTLYNAKESGKFARLEEICETIREKHEKVLVFTQFKDITSYLADFLHQLFGQAGLILHGSVPVKKRKQMIDDFQNHPDIPFFILSLKAGGTGLNLTAANHVIHFDRWWNPAVENQATDRAFRIGQKKSVIVHKFITQGTIEEKIAAMLLEKKELSEKVLSDTEEASWITEMSDEELHDLFKLEGGAK